MNVQRSQAGVMNAFVIPFVLVVLLFTGAAIFGVWAYQQMQDYKNNVDQKVAAAVTSAKQEESTAKDKIFAEKEKSPLRTYTGPSAYGSLRIQYPKSWSGYVSDDGNDDPFVDGYFYPGIVPDINNEKGSYALRVQVTQQSYSDALAEFDDQVEAKAVKVSAYKFPKVPDVVGTRVDGAVEEGKTGEMILMPLRDKTLKVWTNSDQFTTDLQKYILPNLSFSP
ncbi:MAG TPA: hypothetical protein VFL85_00280 [Candidatus Saccharimonadales bacterium]|nr:hypothetical protein [Candidatus Saccharimonadales bacterium]